MAYPPDPIETRGTTRLIGGTPRRIGPIAELVLSWVARQRSPLHPRQVDPDTLRRIELCALAAREAAMFHDLYGMNPEPTGQIVHRDPEDDSGYYLMFGGA